MSEKHSGYEHSDIDINRVKRAGIVFLVAMVLVHGAVWVLYRFWRSEDERLNVRRAVVEVGAPIPPDPRLQVNPGGDFQSYFKEQQKILNNYGWASRADGKVRIPIDRAMDLMIERGLR